MRRRYVLVPLLALLWFMALYSLNTKVGTVTQRTGQMPSNARHDVTKPELVAIVQRCHSVATTSCMDVALQLLCEFDAVAQHHGVTWWLKSGGLLGLARDGAFIKDDDDMDIGILLYDHSDPESKSADALEALNNDSRMRHTIEDMVRLGYHWDDDCFHIEQSDDGLRERFGPKLGDCHATTPYLSKASDMRKLDPPFQIMLTP